MSDAAKLIKERLDIVNFLKQYLELKPAGKNFKALCPFHKEKTPSFMVSSERQSWHCFGCSQGGDIIKFLMLYENLEFYDALKILAEKANIDIKTFDNRDFKSYQALYFITEAAKNFFKSNLTTSQAANDYLKERGLKPETIQEFELGLAPDGSDVLTRHLLKLGYAIADIEKAGLAVKTERGTYWDRFRSRIMFPIYNHLGKAVAFTGRILPERENEKTGKYVNSPETPIFQKSKILYGFHKTKNDIRQSGAAVLVEGQMDFLMMWQDGIRNAVAASGTALTIEHLKALRHLADELILSFDADEAGQAATERAIDLAGANDFSAKLFIIDDDKLKDPADVVRHCPGLAQKLINASKSAMEYYFHKYLDSSFPAEPKLKKQRIRTVLVKIKSLSSALDRNYWLKELSRFSNIDQNFLIEEMEALSVPSAGEPNRILSEPEVGRDSSSGELSRRDLIAQRLLGVLLYKNELERAKEYLQYFPEKYSQIYYAFLEKNRQIAAGDVAELMNMINLRFSFENQNLEEVKLEQEAKLLARELRIEFLKEKRQEIGNLVRRLEGAEDEKKLQEALREFDIVSKELHSI
jgi:DNA primase